MRKRLPLLLAIMVFLLTSVSVCRADSSQEKSSAVARSAVELLGGTGYSRLVQKDLTVSKGTYEFTCLLSDEVRFQQHDHVPGLWDITPDVIRSNVRYERQKDGWVRYSCRMEVQTAGTHDFIIALWGHERVQFADLSLKRTGDDRELLKDGAFKNNPSGWATNGGTMKWHQSLLPVPLLPRLTGQQVIYTTFQGKHETLRGYEGDTLILLIPDSPHYPASRVKSLLRKLELSWNYYAETIGQKPAERTTVLSVGGKEYRNTKPVFAVVHETCGAGCGMVGSCGIETVPSIWEEIWQKHVAGKETRGLFEYEMGRNFWLFHDQLHAPDVPAYHLATAFATIFGFKAGVSAGSTTKSGTELVDWTNSFRAAFDDYLKAPDFRVLTAGGQSAEKIHGGLWLYLGDKYGEGFYLRYFRALRELPRAGNLNEALHNQIKACSVGAGRDLSEWFRESLKFPIGEK